MSNSIIYLPKNWKPLVWSTKLLVWALWSLKKLNSFYITRTKKSGTTIYIPLWSNTPLVFHRLEPWRDVLKRTWLRQLVARSLANISVSYIAQATIYRVILLSNTFLILSREKSNLHTIYIILTTMPSSQKRVMLLY